MRILESRASISLISMYIKVFLEKEVNIKWESRLSQYYNTFERKTSEKLVYKISKSDNVILSIISIIIYWYIAIKSKGVYMDCKVMIPIIIIQTVLIMGEIILTKMFNDYNFLKKDKQTNWQELKKSYTSNMKGKIKNVIL